MRCKYIGIVCLILSTILFGGCGKEVYAQGHILDAVCIPNETIDENVSALLTDENQTILVYCRSGNRSKQAAQKLANLGYMDVREFGGITTWKYEIVR